MVGVRVELGEKFIRKSGKVIGEVAEEVFGTQAWSNTVRKRARTTYIAGCLHQTEAARCELGAHTLLLLLKAD